MWTMHPLAICVPHELIDILEVQQLDDTLCEKIVSDTLIDWPGSLNEQCESRFGVRMRLLQVSSDHKCATNAVACLS